MVEFFLSFYLQINIVRYLFVSGVRVITAWKTNCDLKSINFYQTDVFLILYALEIKVSSINSIYPLVSDSRTL